MINPEQSVEKSIILLNCVEEMYIMLNWHALYMTGVYPPLFFPWPVFVCVKHPQLLIDYRFLFEEIH